MSQVKEGTGSPTGNANSFFKGVVCEVLYDYNLLSDDEIKSLIDTWKIKNSKFIYDAPLNSCVVKFFGSGTTPEDASFLVYPFFPPHISMPVKPGECVWIMSAKVDKPDPEASYWLCRIPGTKPADDTNFTHWPRSFVTGSGTTLSSMKTGAKSQVIAENPPTPEEPSGFNPLIPNFIETIKGDKVINPPTGSLSSLNGFDIINTFSVSNSNSSIEAAPIYSKRVGDLVLQGSNNSLICLGTDRGWGYKDTTAAIDASKKSNSQDEVKKASGTIDLVVGRSRYMPAEMTSASPGDTPQRTSQRTTVNSRNNIESLKNAKAQGLTSNPNAGDPDFVTDSSRLYVTMKTDGDENFGLTTSLERMPNLFEGQIQPASGSAYIISKSDEIRIIARKQTAGEWVSNSDEINGSIRIIKEGKNKEDLATVCLLPDGTIHVNGSKIFLGRSPTDGGTGGGPGPGESQPYVKYQDLEDLWNKTMDALTDFCETLETHTTPGYGHQSPQILAAAKALKAEISSALQPDIKNVKSERIFGE